MTHYLLHRCRRDGTGAVVMAPVPRYTLGEKIGTGHNDGTGAITMAPVPIYQKLTQRCLLLDRTAWGSSQATYCWTVQSRPYNSSTL